MTRHYCAGLIVAIVFSWTPFSFSAETNLNSPVKTSGQGKLYRVDNLHLAVLEGTYYEMGKQYGELLADEIEEVISLASATITSLGGQRRLAKARELIEQQAKYYPKRFHDILRGVADGSELPIEDVAFAEHLVSLFPAVQRGLFCSSLTVWGDYSADGRLIMGRNFDYPNIHQPFTSHMCLTVFNPTDGAVPTATFGFVGQIGSVQTFNRAGLVQEINVAIGFDKANNLIRPERVSIMILLLQTAFDSETFDQADVAIKTMRSQFPLMNTLADSKRANTYEMGTRDVVRRESDEKGMNSVTNFICDPHWKTRPRGDSRQGYLRAAANDKKGTIDFDMMKEIISIPAHEKGAMVQGKGNFISTLYQFVYEPQNQKLAVRIPGDRSEWTEFDLNSFFATAP